VGTLGDKTALEQVFSEYFGFLWHSFISLIPPKSQFIIQGWYSHRNKKSKI
jgi:hypothetical protein